MLTAMHAAPANSEIVTAAIPIIHITSLLPPSLSNQKAPHSGRTALLLFPGWIITGKNLSCLKEGNRSGFYTGL